MQKRPNLAADLRYAPGAHTLQGKHAEAFVPDRVSTSVSPAHTQKMISKVSAPVYIIPEANIERLTIPIERTFENFCQCTDPRWKSSLLYILYRARMTECRLRSRCSTTALSKQKTGTCQCPSTRTLQSHYEATFQNACLP